MLTPTTNKTICIGGEFCFLLERRLDGANRTTLLVGCLFAVPGNLGTGVAARDAGTGGTKHPVGINTSVVGVAPEELHPIVADW